MRSNSKQSIFIVEDNKLYSLYVDSLVSEQFNYKIYSYTSGEDCVKDLYLAPNVIILDYMLGGIDGLEVLSRIKKQLPKTPVILLTAQKNVEIAVKLMKAGADEYIIKDKDAPAKLVDAIVRFRN
jgi:CheY-like chemotaxis protein